MKNLFVFDLDGVGFYLGLYKRFLRQTALHMGIDEEAYIIAYHHSKKSTGIYSQVEHLRFLAEAGYDTDALREAWAHMLGRCGPELINTGFCECLEKLNANPENRVVIVTRGYREVQEPKIRLSGIGDIVKDVYYILEGSKGSPIWSILRNHPECQRVIIADDTIQEIMNMRDFFQYIDVRNVTMTYFHFVWNTQALHGSLADGQTDPLQWLSPDIIPVRNLADFSLMANQLLGGMENV